MQNDPIPTITTERLKLRPFEVTDARSIQRLAGAEEIAATTLNIPHPYKRGMAEGWMRGQAADWHERTNLVLAITTENNGLVGAISLKLEITHRRAELGYWIGVPFWNRGYATEAAEAMIFFGFNELSLNRIEAQFFGENVASGRVMQKIGMTYEGVLREYVVKGYALLDSVRYAILHKEYDEK